MKFEDKEFIDINDLIGMNVILPYTYLGTNDSTSPYKVTITQAGINQLTPTALSDINEALQVNKKYKHIKSPALYRAAYAYFSYDTMDELEVFPKWDYPNNVDFELLFSVE